MKALRYGDRGREVAKWQLFLVGQSIETGFVDGIFGRRTNEGTLAFQRKHRLAADGIVGLRTIGQAMALGYEAFPDTEDYGDNGPNFPSPPDFGPLSGTQARQALFGRFDYQRDGDAGNIKILGGWEQNNIVSVEIPQLRGVAGAPANGTIRAHRLIAQQLRDLFAAWEQQGLLSRVLRWDGMFVPRFIRGSDTVLSAHSFGAAFDINAAQNGYGVEPARVGSPGCVRELVTIANEHGFYWGGHFARRRDGMHFEAVKIISGSSTSPHPPTPAYSGALKLPATPANAVTGAMLYAQLLPKGGKLAAVAAPQPTQPLGRPEREKLFEKLLLEGQVPSFLRDFFEVVLTAPDGEGGTITAVARVSPDYLSIGTDEDFFRTPMSPLTAQRVADAAGCVLPTRKVVDAVYAQAPVKLTPQPMPPGPEMMSSDYYYRHHSTIESQRAQLQASRGSLTGGHKKDVVISARLQARPGRVAIYGWHRQDGRPIQPLSTVHENTYADYSHGIRLMSDTLTIEGIEMKVADVLRDPELCVLLSDEGPLPSARVPGA